MFILIVIMHVSDIGLVQNLGGRLKNMLMIMTLDIEYPSLYLRVRFSLETGQTLYS